MTKRLIVAITGATGALYGVRVLEAMRSQPDWETHLIVSRAGLINARTELDLGREALHALADVVHDERDIAASLSSGSYRTEGMIIAPCSVRTLAAVASGVTDNLVTRAADVVLKERRRLVLMVRETPLHLGHLRDMVTVTEIGAICMPPVPAFYGRPQGIDDIVNHTVGRALDLFGIDAGLAVRWQGLAGRPGRAGRPGGED